MKQFSAPFHVLVCFVILICLCAVPLRAATFEAPFVQQNSNVTIRVGLFEESGREVDICVKAEGRRLVFYAPGVNLNKGSTNDVKIESLPSGDHYEIKFSVNTRTPALPGGGRGPDPALPAGGVPGGRRAGRDR